MKSTLHQSKLYVLKTTILGAVLGLGAPLGYVIYSFFISNPNHLTPLDWGKFLWSEQIPLLAYLTLPTIAVFSVFGYLNGRQKFRLANQAQQMEEFLHIAAHDIRNPLSTALRIVELLKEDSASEQIANKANLIAMLDRQLCALLDLVSELLDIYKMESGTYRLERQDIALENILKNILDEMSLMFETKKLKTSLISETPGQTLLSVDPFRLKQVLRNVLSNAIKFADDSSTVTCTLVKTLDNGVKIKVHNYGPTIPADRLATIFDKFAQSRNRDQKLGYGLGLTICKNIMDLHQGKIWVENTGPSGVCMHIEFPGK